MQWPDGSAWAVTMGWDDGTSADRRLVDRLRAFGLPATFFLNSGKFGLTAQQSGWKDYVGADEVANLYAGHEVASHTVDHPNLVALPDEEIADQVGRDRAALEHLVGYPVTGFASPFRAQDSRVEAVLRSLGMRYSRGPGADPTGAPPSDPLHWVPLRTAWPMSVRCSPRRRPARSSASGATATSSTSTTRGNDSTPCSSPLPARTAGLPPTARSSPRCRAGSASARLPLRGPAQPHPPRRPAAHGHAR